jgi:hypothetical protein
MEAISAPSSKPAEALEANKQLSATNREGWAKEEDALLTQLVNSNTMTWYVIVLFYV